MKPGIGEEILTKLNWRYAVKKFDSTKKIPQAQWDVLAEVLRLAPSSYGLQPWKFILVQNSEIRRKLTLASFKQTQIEECSHLLVFTTLKKVSDAHVRKMIAHTEQVREMPQGALKGYADFISADLVTGPRGAISQHWTQRQAYIAMGSLMTAAALLSIDTCAMEGIDTARYDEILGLSGTDHSTVATVALGYRSAEDASQSDKKVRFSLDHVIHVIR